MLKRTMDIVLAVIGMALCLPLLPVIGLLIKLDSRGPVFYGCDRVGRDMAPFKMLKFRTLLETPVEVGGSLCPQKDPRVTPFGRFLRRTKLNELPQLVNVLKGEMTFVGPRAESPDLAELYPPDAKKIFSVKPGLVGPNQILGRNEEELYPPGVDEKEFYIEHILPQKVEVDLKYIEKPTFLNDMKYIFLGLKETLLGAVSRSHIRDNRSQVCLAVADILLCVGSFALACLISFRGGAERPSFMAAALFLGIFLAVRCACFVGFGLYRSLIRFISYQDIAAVFKAVTAGSLAAGIAGFFFGLNGGLKVFLAADWVFLILTLSGLRFGLRFYWETRNRAKTPSKPRKVLIFGAGQAGLSASRALTLDRDRAVEVVGFIDDAPEKYGKRLNGIKVLGDRHHIAALARLYHVTEIILAFRSASPDKISRIIDIPWVPC